LNKELLRETIEGSGYKLIFIASKLDVTYQGLLNKLNGITEFKLSEVRTLCDLLNIDNQTKEDIFFNQNVDYKSTRSPK